MARRPSRRRTARQYSLPAPTGGWNARDNIAAMPPLDAVILDNWFPSTGYLQVRNGNTEFADGVGVGSVFALMAYSSGTANEFFAASETNIYDITSGGTASSVVSSMTNGQWQYVNYTTSGGSFLLAVNGADTPREYDGTNWSASTISASGLTTANLINIWVHKNRIWFVEKDTLDAWYLSTGAIAGTAVKFPLGAVFQLGGELIAGGSWSRDGGDGMDDLQVFITSNGEVAVYQGTDPASADTFALVGVFRIGRPLGYRCVEKFGADLIVVTDQGYLPLSQVLRLDPSQAEAQAISDKIRDAVSEAARSYGGNFGWQAISYPKGNWGLFNVPTSEGEQARQHVVNVLTGAWCRFTGMNAVCWEVFNDDLYFGGQNGFVYKADSGESDDGDPVNADCLQAFTDAGLPGTMKRYTMLRPLFRSDGSLGITLQFNVDYAISAPGTNPTPGTASGPVWDVALWNVSYWAGPPVPVMLPTSVVGIGTVASARIRCSVDAQQVQYLKTDYLFEPGGFL